MVNDDDQDEDQNASDVTPSDVQVQLVDTLKGAIGTCFQIASALRMLTEMEGGDNVPQTRFVVTVICGHLGQLAKQAEDDGQLHVAERVHLAKTDLEGVLAKWKKSDLNV